MGAKSSKLFNWLNNKKTNFVHYIRKKKYDYENRRAKEIYMKVFCEDLDFNDNPI